MIGNPTVYNIYQGRVFLCYTASLRTAKTKARELNATAIVEIDLNACYLKDRVTVVSLSRAPRVWRPSEYNEWYESFPKNLAEIFDNFY